MVGVFCPCFSMAWVCKTAHIIFCFGLPLLVAVHNTDSEAGTAAVSHSVKHLGGAPFLSSARPPTYTHHGYRGRSGSADKLPSRIGITTA